MAHLCTDVFKVVKHTNLAFLKGLSAPFSLLYSLFDPASIAEEKPYTKTMDRLGKLSIKFLDIMIGVVLGLGFQWWPNLNQPWEFAAFIFVYFDLVDYWIDYSASIKKFPPRKELGILLDVAVIFTMFLYIYTTQLTLVYFLAAFVLFRVVDTLCLWRTRIEHRPAGRDSRFVQAWINNNLIEVAYSVGLVWLAYEQVFSVPVLLGTFIVLRLATRVIASLQYKEVYFS
jgi:hypothetical protein